MIGLIQKVLFDMIEDQAGASALQEFKQRVGLSPEFVFRIDTDYDDAQMHELLQEACKLLQVDADTAFSLYAKYFLAAALELFPAFFRMSHSAREFLARQPAIHNIMASGLRDPERRKIINDKFAMIDHIQGPLEVSYRSENQWCSLFMALAREVAAHYGESVSIEIPDCRKRGAERCTFHLQFVRISTDD